MSPVLAAMLLMLAPAADGPLRPKPPGVEAAAPETALPAPPAAALPAPMVETDRDVAYRIGKDIRCPVCQGMSIAESPSAMAQDMMVRVRAMLNEGKNADDIRAWFVQRYGVWVLLDPPKQGFILLVWVVPPVMLVSAGALALRHMRRLRRMRGVGAPASDGPTGADLPQPGTNASNDAWLQAVRDEVQR